MKYSAITLTEKLELFSEHWSPRIVARLNEYHVKLVKFQGDFVWHNHDDTDEMFLVLKGSMVIDFRDGNVQLGEGDLFIVPAGVEHKPYAADECSVMVIEPAGTINTGNAGGELTADEIWLEQD